MIGFRCTYTSLLDYIITRLGIIKLSVVSLLIPSSGIQYVRADVRYTQLYGTCN